MTRWFDATFEGASLTGANGATSTVGSPTLDNTALLKGTYSAFFNATVQYCRFDFTVGDDIYVSLYLYLPSTPAANDRFIYINNAVRLDLRTTGRLRLADAAGTQIGSDSGILSNNTLYRVGVHWKKATGAGNDGQAEAYVTATGSPDAAFGAAFASSTTLTQTAQLGRVDVGNTTTPVCNFYVDDVRIDNAAMPGPSVSSTQVDTAYTAGTYVVKRTDNNYTAGTYLQKTSNNNYTAGVIAAAVISSAYTAGVVVNVQPSTPYTAGVPVIGTINTGYTARTIAQGTFNNAYTAAVIASILNSVAYTAGVSLSAVINTTYTVGVAIQAAAVQLFYPFPFSNNRDETSFWLYDEFGNLLRVIEPDEYLSGGYQLAVNQVTRLQLQLPGAFPYDLLRRDGWVLPVRCINGSPGLIDANQVFMLTQRTKKHNDNTKVVELQAETANTILKRRIVAYDAETSQADKTGLADNLILAYMRENFGSLAVDTARRVTEHLTIQGDRSLGSSVEYSGSRKSIESVLSDLARASADAGKPLYYEVILDSIAEQKLLFKVQLGQRGLDRTISGGAAEALLSEETGTLANVQLVEDYTKGWNYVYAIGKGTEQQQLIKTSDDPASIGTGPFARTERSVSATDAETEGQVQTKANQHLRLGRNKKQYSAEVPDAGIYGSKIFFGDKVNADLDGVVYPVMLSAVDVKVGPGGDKVRLALRTEV